MARLGNVRNGRARETLMEHKAGRWSRQGGERRRLLQANIYWRVSSPNMVGGRVGRKAVHA